VAFPVEVPLTLALLVLFGVVVVLVSELVSVSVKLAGIWFTRTLGCS